MHSFCAYGSGRGANAMLPCCSCATAALLLLRSLFKASMLPVSDLVSQAPAPPPLLLHTCRVRLSYITMQHLLWGTGRLLLGGDEAW